MENISQEIKKIEDYQKLQNFDVSVFMFKMMGIIILSTSFAKYVLTPLWDGGNDLLTLTTMISIFGFAWYEINKIKQNSKKQEQFKFEMVNAYDFISNYLSTNTKFNSVDSNVIYKIVTAKVLEHWLKTSIDNERLQIIQQEIDNKTIKMSTLKIVQFVNGIRVKHV